MKLRFKQPWKEKRVIGDAVLYLGDCSEVLPRLQKVDALITDPNYGIGIAANPFRQKFAKQDWDNQPASPEHIAACRKAAVAQIIWGGNYFDLPPTQCFLIWDKHQPEDFSSAMCEYAWTNIKGPAKMFRRHVASYEKFHPTTKPLELMVWCIRQAGSPTTVIDPFMGSGTTGVAALHLGRKFIGIEVNPEYFKISCKRIEKELARPSLFREYEKVLPTEKPNLLG